MHICGEKLVCKVSHRVLYRSAVRMAVDFSRNIDAVDPTKRSHNKHHESKPNGPNNFIFAIYLFIEPNEKTIERPKIGNGGPGGQHAPRRLRY